MKKSFNLLIIGIFLVGFSTKVLAQDEDYKALNLHFSFSETPAINAHYEISIVRNVTISPSIFLPLDFDNLILGVRADYYFDELLELAEPWDIWGGVDTGFFVNKSINNNNTLNGHIGVEYKFNEMWGVIVEIGGGSSSFGGLGVGIHI